MAAADAQHQDLHGQVVSDDSAKRRKQEQVGGFEMGLETVQQGDHGEDDGRNHAHAVEQALDAGIAVAGAQEPALQARQVFGRSGREISYAGHEFVPDQAG